MAKTSSQVTNGKAFEYALLYELYLRLKILTKVIIVDNVPYKTAKKCFDTFSERDKEEYQINASAAINLILDVEPRLSNGINEKDILELEIVPDRQGQLGDVRDVLAVRLLQKWEIGISAKNNHKAVKHSRLSGKIDFGKKWLGLSCSETYFNEVTPIFDSLANLRKESKSTKTWESLGDYHSSIYVPVLDAFAKEMWRLDKENPGVVAHNLVEYLVGNKDFYKVIKTKAKVEVIAFNLNNTLNQPFQNIKPKGKIGKLKLPNKLKDIAYADNSKTTLDFILSDGWQISFRIHNASSRIESSLKFDINLVGIPDGIFKNQHLFGLSEV